MMAYSRRSREEILFNLNRWLMLVRWTEYIKLWVDRLPLKVPLSSKSSVCALEIFESGKFSRGRIGRAHRRWFAFGRRGRCAIAFERSPAESLCIQSLQLLLFFWETLPHGRQDIWSIESRVYCLLELGFLFFLGGVQPRQMNLLKSYFFNFCIDYSVGLLLFLIEYWWFFSILKRKVWSRMVISRNM